MTIIKKINLLFGILLFSLVYLFSARQVHAAPRLYFSPSNDTYYKNQTFSVDVYLDSDGINHKEGHVEIDFDNTLLEVETITDQAVYYTFPTINNYYDNLTGKIVFQGDFYSNAYPNSGKLFRINFKAKATSSSYTLSFNNATYIKDASDLPISPLTKETTTLIFNTPDLDSLLTLNSLYDSWSKNDTQEILIDLDTKGNDIAGVDIILNYNPSLFEYQNYTWSGLLPTPQGYSVDTVNGRITISGVANQGSPINTRGNLIKLAFKALTTTGSGNFSFDWTSNSTIDTNIVSYYNQNTDLLVTQPAVKSISVIDSATLDFSFNLLNFLGLGKNRNGTITVSGPNVMSNFVAIINSGIANVTGHSLGTFTYGQAYDLIISVPGYLKKKITNQVINAGINSAQFADLKPGDIYSDGVVNSSDLQYLYSSWNRTDYPIEDLNADGKVNTFDVSILYSQFNEIDNI